MSVEPPSSGRPTGPPSGPLSGPSQPPPVPPPDGSWGGPPGGSSGGSSGGASGGTPGGPPSGGGPEPRRPWWKSVPRTALLATALVVAVAVVLVVTLGRGGGGDGGAAPAGEGEVFLQAAGGTGPDPFTESTATDSSVPPTTTASVTAFDTATPSANALRGVDGATPGLYGGTRSVAACDVEKQITALQAQPAKNSAFASVAGVGPGAVPAYLRSLTPVKLRMDTRVTNHGYRDGAATPYQAVLQSGTAVLVDAHGVPRVRCACGNPLTPPVAQRTTPRTTGEPWPGYRAANVVVITPSATVVEAFVLYDADTDTWFTRDRGDTGDKDRPTEPRTTPTAPSASPSLPNGTTTRDPGRPSTGPSAPSPRSDAPPPSGTAPTGPASPPGASTEPQSEPEHEPETEDAPPTPAPPPSDAPSRPASPSAEKPASPEPLTSEPTL
ncbi:DUF6777 domain-containing protein [Streptomyces sp. NPDC002328]|uniref:DUF6777 domain-containing protein n=1 Tax=Streptomyces sp. NPDC002328 TaxID=3364642 RepID=UPI003691E4D3